MTLQNGILAGSIAGLAGGVALSVWWRYGQQLGITQEPLPKRVEHWAEDHANVAHRPSPQAEEGIAQGGHLLAATALGAVYGGLRSAGLLPASIASGPLFGLGVYGLTVAGLGNLLGMTRGPGRESGTVWGQQMFEHAVYGTVTSLVVNQLSSRTRMRG